MADELNCIDLDGLSQLLSTLKNNGYRVIGPKEKEGQKKKKKPLSMMI
jgi:hypothetical protein